MPTAKLQEAITHHRAGRLAEAEALYRQLLAANNTDADAWHLLGVIACQRGDFSAAREHIERAIRLNPNNAEFHINLGEALRRANAFEDAIRAFGKAAELQPDNAYSWYNLGVVLALSGRKADAIDAYTFASECPPPLPEARNNLGVLLYESDDARAAIPHFRAAIALSPAHAEAHNNLGLALWHEHAHDEALAAFEKAATLKPAFAAAYANAAAGLRWLGRRDEAAAAFRRAAAADPSSSAIQRDFGMLLLDSGDKPAALAACARAVELARGPADAGEAHHALAVALARSDQDSQAIEAYEKAVSLRPDMAEWRFELAALRGESTHRAPDVFVKALFDAYAWKFEKHLVEELGYRVPEELLAATRACAAQDATLRRPPWDILDLGCGTGRCGELFRTDTRSIIGVDLAPKMIEASRRRGVYTALEEGHILPTLQRRHDAFDLILAADVFIYVGDMEEVFSAAHRALRPGGMLAFSIENHPGEGFQLHKQYRFAHSPSYIRQLAARGGFAEKHFRQVTLRTDVPPGWVVVLAK